VRFSGRQILIGLAIGAGIVFVMLIVWFISTADERAISGTVDDLRQALVDKAQIKITAIVSPEYDYDGVKYDDIATHAKHALDEIRFDELEFEDVTIDVEKGRADVKFRMRARIAFSYRLVSGLTPKESTPLSARVRLAMTKESGKWLIREIEVTDIVLSGIGVKHDRLPLRPYLPPPT
jgi:hypothetical protein